MVVLAERARRPAGAILGAVVAWWAVALVLDNGLLTTSMPRPLVLGSAAVVGAALSALKPGLASIGAGALAGHLLQESLLALLPGDPDVVRMGSVAGGLMLGAFSAVASPGMVPMLVGALLVMLGAWGAVLASGAVPALAGLSAVWWTLFGVTCVLGTALQSGRAERQSRASKRKAEKQAAADARRKEKEMRERYARYME
jgi:hypothetical protein